MSRTGLTRSRSSGWMTRAKVTSAAAPAPAMPPKRPPVTKSPTSLFVWCGSKTSLTAIQNWVTAMEMKMSDQKQKAITATEKWPAMICWALRRKANPDGSTTGDATSPFIFRSKMYQKTKRLAMKNRSEAVRYVCRGNRSRSRALRATTKPMSRAVARSAYGHQLGGAKPIRKLSLTGLMIQKVAVIRKKKAARDSATRASRPRTSPNPFRNFSSRPSGTRLPPQVPGSSGLAKALQGLVTILVDIEDLVQHGDLEDEEELVRDPAQLELAAEILRRDVAGQDLAHAEAVDELHAGEVEQDVPPAMVELGLDQAVEGFLRGVGAADLPLDVEDDDVPGLPCFDDHAR